MNIPTIKHKLYGFLWALSLALLCVSGAQGTEVITYYHNDASGTPLLATDATGSVVWKESYRPYGERTIRSGAGASNKIAFAGKPFDANTGLSYQGARYYDPGIGRFLAVDPKTADPADLYSLNRYAYGNNNPYRFVDPDGRSPLDVGFLAFDLAHLAQALWKGEGVGEAGLGVAFSAVGVITPMVGVGEALKAAHAATKLAKLANETGHAAKSVVINAQKQAGHVPGTSQNINRIKQGKPTSSFHGEQSGEMATRIAHERGTPVPGRPNVKEHDFGVGIGTGPNGGAQTRVRVHESPKTGEIHGHPSGPERF